MLQDYVKWRGHLFHQFLRTLVDCSARVRNLAEYLLADTLASKVSYYLLHQCHQGISSPGCDGRCNDNRLPRKPSAMDCMSLRAGVAVAQAPLLAYNHFVEAVFVLNECRAGLQAAGVPEEGLSQVLGSSPGSGGGGAFSLTGQACRGKRDIIYR